MGFMNFFEKWFPVKSRIGPSTVVVDIPAELYYKEIALHTGITLIANAIAKCEIRKYEKNKETKDEDYYLLNIAPNDNQTASQFWYEIIEKSIRKGEAFAVEYNGKLYSADSCVLEEEDPIRGNYYFPITVGNYQFPKRYNAKELFDFRNNCYKTAILMENIGQDYGKMLSSAAKAFKESNATKYKLKIEETKAGDDDFNKEFENVIKQQLETYIKSECGVYPEFSGYELTRDSTTQSKSSEDVIKLRKDMFEMVANALHIPLTLMTGNITNMNEIVKVFLTFCIDPFADVIEEALNKCAGYENWIDGSYYKVDTGKINHRDIFDLAQNMDKLIASGLYCIDEIREEIGKEPLNTEWSRQHWMTKNYVTIDNMMYPVEGGANESS